MKNYTHTSKQLKYHMIEWKNWAHKKISEKVHQIYRFKTNLFYCSVYQDYEIFTSVNNFHVLQ